MNAVKTPRIVWGTRVRTLPSESGEDERIVLGLLSSVGDGANSQRRIASELGIALGLVNAYLKRCVLKGYVKVSQAPARRYAYYLTPQGFAEKSRLTVEYLSYSFSFFREAKADCARAFATAKERNFKRLVLCGRSELAEIAILSAVDSEVSVVAIIDAGADGASFVGKPVVDSYDRLSVPFDAVLITDLVGARRAFDEATARYGADRVLSLRLLGLQDAQRGERKS
jgi:DNA-binding MarR family transcriptional regulator